MTSYGSQDALSELEGRFFCQSLKENKTKSLEIEMIHLQRKIKELTEQRNKLTETLKNKNSIQSNDTVTSDDINSLMTAYRFCGVTIEELNTQLLATFDMMYKDTHHSSYSLSLNITTFPPTVIQSNLPSFESFTSLNRDCKSRKDLSKYLKKIYKLLDAYVSRSQEVENLKMLCSNEPYSGLVEIHDGPLCMNLEIITAFSESDSSSIFKVLISLNYNLTERFPSGVIVSLHNGEPSDAYMRTITKRSNNFMTSTLCKAFEKLFKKSI